MRNKGQADYLREAHEHISALERELNEAYRALSNIGTLWGVTFDDAHMYCRDDEDQYDVLVGELRAETICALDRARSKPRWPST